MYQTNLNISIRICINKETNLKTKKINKMIKKNVKHYMNKSTHSFYLGNIHYLLL